MSAKLKELILSLVLGFFLFYLYDFILKGFGIKDDTVNVSSSVVIKYESKRDSFKVVVDSLEKQLYLDSVVISEFKQHHYDKIDSISGMSVNDLYRIWSDGHISNTELGTAGGIPK